MTEHDQDFFERVWDVVAQIPHGKVTTYGHIAEYLGTKSAARTVGWALNGAKGTGLPAHRVVNRYGALWFGDASNINADRLPAYHRLDVRATYQDRWGDVGLELYVDLINLYNRKNTVTNQYFVEIIERPRPDLPIALQPPPRPLLLREPVYMFPFIPSFGFRLVF